MATNILFPVGNIFCDFYVRCLTINYGCFLVL